MKSPNSVDQIVRVIIPAYNEENAVGKVVSEIPPDIVKEVIVVNNNSTDKTEEAARLNGATVLEEQRKGYGYACLKGINYVKRLREQTHIVVFIDADYSDYPAEMNLLVKPIVQENYDLVIGSRTLGKREPGSMTFQQIIGNRVATFLINLLYGYKYTDLGPFRAMKFDRLLELDMHDKTYGWTVEMQLKAAKANMKYKDVPVSYRKRIGFSKVSGTLKGTILAGYKIIWTIFKYL